MLAIHGRTRACAFRGHAEYDTIAEVKSRLRIPVVANGDVDTPEEARRVLEATGADGIMIGRAAQGRPWLFREIAHFLATGEPAAPAPPSEIRAVLLEHLEALYELYGEEQGTRVARKHIGSWTVRALRPAARAVSAARRSAFFDERGGAAFRSERLLLQARRMNRQNELADSVKRSLERYFKDMDGEKPTSIYDMVLKNVEKPMIEMVLAQAKGNQTLAAQMLGINRNTLRTKMQQLRIKG